MFSLSHLTIPCHFKFMLTEDIQLGYRIAKVGDKLIEESQNKHALRSRLCHELDGTLKAVVEPVQNFVTTLPERYNSAILTGDTASAMLSLLGYCIGWIHTGKELTSISKSYVNLIKRSVREFDQTIESPLALFTASNIFMSFPS